ncbi:MAG: tail fiber domain-containing protein [Ferruginibacter sp.]
MKIIILFFATLILLNNAPGQNVGIGTATPNNTAKLEISDTAKGMLIPRIDSIHRVNIANPARGLMLYETNSETFWFFNSSNWLRVGNGAISSAIADGDGNTNIKTEQNPDENIIRFSLNGNEKWRMKNAALEPSNPSNSIYIGNAAGMNDGLSSVKNNIALGQQALFSNTSGNKIIAIGDSALYFQTFDTTGMYANTAIGSKSMFSNTIGHSNTAIGFESLYSNVNGRFNVAAGKQALYNNIDGVDNTAIGDQTMFFNTTGSFNSALGDWCLRINTIGSLNTAGGIQALYNNSTGSQNTAHGCLALDNNSSGNLNTANGYFAGLNNTTGNSNTLIGSFADVIGGNLTNAGAIGYNAKVAQSNSFVIGGTGVDAINVGIGTTSPTEKLDVQGNIKATGTITPSDARFKRNIQPLQNSLQKLLLLHGVSYDWRLDEFPNKGFDSTRQLGFIAQEVEKLFPQLVHTGVDGYKGVDYSKMLPVLVEALKEQNTENELLKLRVEKLEAIILNRK